MISEVLFEHNMKIMQTIPDKYFDWAIDDIPYGINAGKMAYVSAKTTIKQRNGNLTHIRSTKNYTTSDWDSTVPPQAYFDELRRISKNQIVFGINYTTWSGVGTGRIAWDKMVADQMSFSRYEYAYCSAIDHTHHIVLLHSGMMQAKSIKEPTVMQGDKRKNEKRIHPTQKPVLLYDIIYSTFVEPGMKVIDPHLGSGSNRISADKYGISEFLGIENNSTNYLKQEKRWAQYKAQLVCDFTIKK